MQVIIQQIKTKCPRCGSDRIVSSHTVNANDSVNYLREYRCLNCGIIIDAPKVETANSVVIPCSK